MRAPQLVPLFLEENHIFTHLISKRSSGTMESIIKFRCILWLFLFTFYMLQVLGSIEFSSFLRYFPLDSLTCSSENTVFRMENIFHLLACALVCSTKDHCHGVYFDNVTKECKGCAADFYDIPQILNGSVYYARNSKYIIIILALF
jgi:hypothetical protein